GKRILVMISDIPSHEKWGDPPSFTFSSGDVIKIRDVFPKSGCYDAATLRPIWQVEWFSLAWDMGTSPDFKHLVRRHRRAISGGNALEFYDDGTLVRAYTCSQL